MVDIDPAEAPSDGRVARRERNVNAVLDVVLEMFVEDALFPTIEQVSQRSGLSLRSIYRYFADPAELLEAVIVRSRERSEVRGHIPAIGQGPLDKRIADFVEIRVRLHEKSGSMYRATVANAVRHPRVGDELSRTRDALRDQFERHFAPELASMKKADRVSVVAAGDLLTQLDSIELLIRHRQLSERQVQDALRSSLSLLLAS